MKYFGINKVQLYIEHGEQSGLFSAQYLEAGIDCTREQEVQYMKETHSLGTFLLQAS